MIEDGEIQIHCSELVRWTACEKAAVWNYQNPAFAPPRMPHIATWMGSAVHARCADAPEPDAPEPVVFDKVSPNLSVARHQVEMMADSVSCAIDREGWEIKDRETQFPDLCLPDWPFNLRLVGRCDLRASWSGGRCIVDIKTSRNFEPAAIQLGGYRLLDRMSSGREPATTVATVHCPRPDILPDHKMASIHYYAAEAAKVEAVRIMARIADLIRDPARGTATPGNRCRYCVHPDCVTRTHHFSPR